jgi:hypothetical protein
MVSPSAFPLNDLDYCWPAGFASFRLAAWNPGRGGFLPGAELVEIAAALGSHSARYMRITDMTPQPA